MRVASLLTVCFLASCAGASGSNDEASATDASPDAPFDSAAVDDASPDGGLFPTDDASADTTPALPKNTSFRAPLNTDPDPFMTFYDGNYYLATTQGDAIRMWKAPSIGQLLAAPAHTVWHDPDGTRNQQVWAPSFYLFDGHWYVYYTADDGVDDHHRMYVVESDGTDPLGPYHFKAKIAPPGAENWWAIDPVLFKQSSGLYVAWSGAGTEGHNLIYVAKMSDPWTMSSARTYLPASGGCTEVREAPAILQHGGTTFLVYSTCDTGKPDYQLWMKSIPTTGDPLNAAQWHQFTAPVLTRNDGAGVFGPGSNGFFQSPDGKEDWIVYHAKNTVSYTYDARTTRAQRIQWNADGTPDFGAAVATGDSLDLPSGDPGLGPYWINDDGSSSGMGKLTYSDGWTSYPKCGNQCFKGDDHGSAVTDATATFTFVGTQIALLSARDVGNGIAGISLDGGAEAMVDYQFPIRQGEQLNYLSPHVAYGSHTLKVRVTGMKGAGTGPSLSIDRAEVYTQ